MDLHAYSPKRRVHGFKLRSKNDATSHCMSLFFLRSSNGYLCAYSQFPNQRNETLSLTLQCIQLEYMRSTYPTTCSIHTNINTPLFVHGDGTTELKILSNPLLLTHQCELRVPPVMSMGSENREAMRFMRWVRLWPSRYLLSVSTGCLLPFLDPVHGGGASKVFCQGG